MGAGADTRRRCRHRGWRSWGGGAGTTGTAGPTGVRSHSCVGDSSDAELRSLSVSSSASSSSPATASSVQGSGGAIASPVGPVSVGAASHARLQLQEHVPQLQLLLRREHRDDREHRDEREHRDDREHRETDQRKRARTL